MSDRKKTTQDILQEELLRERAAVLARAGEKVAAAQKRLAEIEAALAPVLAAWEAGPTATAADAPAEVPPGREVLRERINEQIHSYNRERDRLRRRYYELIVTREALGMIHHQRLEEFYRIPSRKKALP